MSTKKKAPLKPMAPVPAGEDALYGRITRILEEARSHVVRSVNSAQVAANWLIGREIVEEEQQGAARAGYGEELIESMGRALSRDYGRGFSATNLRLMRQFYLTYPSLLGASGSIYHTVCDELEGEADCLEIRHTPCAELTATQGLEPIHQTVCDELAGVNTGRRKPGKSIKSQAVSDELQKSGSATLMESAGIPNAACSESRASLPAADDVDLAVWSCGQLHPNLSWSHYRLLMRVEKRTAREFYEEECIEARWSTRELERQIGSLYYERLLMSKNRKKMILENRKGAVSAHAAAALEVIKDPYVLEFLGLPEDHTLNETDLETRLVSQLQTFLMELGRGFAFIGRQQRLTLEGDHFYADLVFYHTRLKCYVVLDLKTKKLTHADLGQMQLYVNYYDEEIAAEDDNPTLGLILCTDKNETVCRYVLGKENRTIFTSRYQLHLPTEEELTAELKRELALIKGGKR